jgi:hypothetical protein
MRVERRFTILATALAGIMGAAMVTSALGETQTYDEGIHAAAGYSYWTLREYHHNPEHPALGKMLLTLPLLYLRPNLDTSSEAWKKEHLEQIGVDFLYGNRLSPETILFAGRFVNIGVTVLFAAYVAWWTRRRFGELTALAALALLAFDPNFIAHGRYVTTDVLAAATIFITCTLWIEYVVSHRRVWLILSGVSLGVAFTSKYSSLYLAAVLPVMFWVAHPRITRKALREFVLAGSVVAVLVTAVIAVVYLPEVLHPDPYTYLRNRLTGQGFAGSVLLAVAQRIPIPTYHWFVGIDRVSEYNSVGRPGYLLGQFSNQGWWYYFPVAFAVKTPLALIAGSLLSAGLLFRTRMGQGRTLILLAVPAVSYFAVSMVTSLNIGYRHILPFLPFVYVLTACILLAAAQTRRWVATATALLITGVALESLSRYPDYLAFFNIAAGGPSAGHKHLLDSNLDWGQAYRAAGRYVREQGVAEVCLFPFGNGAPQLYVPGPSLLDPAHLDRVDCVAAVSATPLFGLYVGPEKLAALRAREPMAIIGHSIYLYDLRQPRPSAIKVSNETTPLDVPARLAGAPGRRTR